MALYEFKLLTYLPDTAPGSDGIQATLLKHASESLALPLAQPHQSLSNLGVVLKEWKLAMVTPIFKKGKSIDQRNYRFISPSYNNNIVCN